MSNDLVILHIPYVYISIKISESRKDAEPPKWAPLNEVSRELS